MTPQLGPGMTTSPALLYVPPQISSYFSSEPCNVESQKKHSRQFSFEFFPPKTDEGQEKLRSTWQVLVDAPCTGLGALRRRPEARWRRQPRDVAGLVTLQGELLSAAIDAAAVGGVIGYVTCSPHRAETVGVVSTILQQRSDIEAIDARALLPDVPELGAGPWVQLWPHIHGTDAMFCALLRRTG